MSKRGVVHDNYFDNLCKLIEFVIDAASSQTVSSAGHSSMPPMSRGIFSGKHIACMQKSLMICIFVLFVLYIFITLDVLYAPSGRFCSRQFSCGVRIVLLLPVTDSRSSG